MTPRDERYDWRGFSVSTLFYVLAAVAFVVALFVDPGSDLSQLDVVSLGLASFAVAHVVP